MQIFKDMLDNFRIIYILLKRWIVTQAIGYVLSNVESLKISIKKSLIVNRQTREMYKLCVYKQISLYHFEVNIQKSFISISLTGLPKRDICQYIYVWKHHILRKYFFWIRLKEYEYNFPFSYEVVQSCLYYLEKLLFRKCSILEGKKKG